MTEQETIVFDATISKVSTMSDMGLRVVLDMPEHAVMQAAELMAARQAGATLVVRCEIREKQSDA